jgi:protein-S-isoprenylcysteine O-methyltransferase Ste14
LVGTALFAGIVCVWRPLLQFHRYGKFGINLFRSGRMEQHVRDSLLILMFVLMLGQSVAAAWWPQTISLLVPGTGLTFAVAQIVGAVLFFGGLALLVAAQLDLGASWQIGIEDNSKPGLVTSGLYGWSRNPIYLALFVIVAGYFLLLPTVLSGLLLLGTCVGIWQQTSAEEAYLLRTYGEAFRDYARRVGRFLPGLGKFR